MCLRLYGMASPNSDFIYTYYLLLITLFIYTVATTISCQRKFDLQQTLPPPKKNEKKENILNTCPSS